MEDERQGHAIADSLEFLSLLPISSSKLRLQNERDAAVYPRLAFNLQYKTLASHLQLHKFMRPVEENPSPSVVTFIFAVNRHHSFGRMILAD